MLGRDISEYDILIVVLICLGIMLFIVPPIFISAIRARQRKIINTPFYYRSKYIKPGCTEAFVVSVMGAPYEGRNYVNGDYEFTYIYHHVTKRGHYVYYLKVFFTGKNDTVLYTKNNF